MARQRKIARSSAFEMGMAVWAIVLLAGISALAQQPPIKVDIHLKLMLKTLEFNRAFALAEGRPVRIGILYQEAFPTSHDVGRDAESCLASGQAAIAGHTAVVVALPFTSVNDLDSILAADSIVILYVAPLRSADVGAISAVTRAHHVLSMTGVPSYVSDGIALGVDVKGGRPELLINQSAALAEGAQFSSQLLRLATVVGATP